MNLQALEAEIVKDLAKAPAIAKEVADFIVSVKGSFAEPLLERLWPGIAAVEDEAVKALGFLSSLSPDALNWITKLFPKAS